MNTANYCGAGYCKYGGMDSWLSHLREINVELVDDIFEEEWNLNVQYLESDCTTSTILLRQRVMKEQ